MTNIGTKYILAQQFIFDPYSNTLIDLNNDNDIVRLGSNESRILLILIENSNQVVSRDQLHEYVWRDQGFQVDDSSLTQAISTLRKMLQDSTKSPQFVKTVPKRGYQLIAEVDIAAPIKSTENNANEIVESDDGEPAVNLEIATPSVGSAQNEVTSVGEPPQIQQSPSPWWIKLVWVLIIMIPILAWVSHVPTSKDLTQIDKLDDTPLLIPANQQEISKWLPVIKICTKAYQSQSNDKAPLTQIIATGGTNDNITLNYIHDLEYADQNKTIVLFVDQTNFKSLCK